jgi:hypothetical protein
MTLCTAEGLQSPENESVAMAMKCFVTISLAIGLATLASAQNPPTPDFSGTWTLNLAKSKLVKGSPLISETIVIVCSGQTMQFHYTTTRRDYTYTFITDGQEHPVAQYQDGAEIAKAAWKKEGTVIALVVKSKSSNMPAFLETTGGKDTWTISSDGRVLTDKVSSEYGGEVSVYDKR